MLIKLNEDNFKEEVLNSTEIVIVKFGAEWCKPCKMLNPIMEQISTEKSLKIYDVDVDECPNLSSQFGIKGVPTTIVFKDGVAQKTVVGMLQKSKMLESITII